MFRFQSEKYKLKSLLKPSVLEFNTFLDYPKYTKLKDEKLNNIGDFTLPEGTRISWDFQLKNTDSVLFIFNDKYEKHKIINDHLFIKKSALQSGSYSISASNQNIHSEKTNYFITILPDEFPKISLETKLDSINNQLFFNGTISDDYSVSELKFVYEVILKDSSYIISDNILINNNSEENYYHYLDLNTLKLSPSDNLNYYFEVWDNDDINGRKSTKSYTGKHSELSLDKLNEIKDKEDGKIKEKLDKIDKLREHFKEDKELPEDMKKTFFNFIEKSQNSQKEKLDKIDKKIKSI